MSLSFNQYFELSTGTEALVYNITADNLAHLSRTYSPVEMIVGSYLVILPGGRWDVMPEDVLNQDFILKAKLTFNSAADARQYAQELNYAIDHPDEDDLSVGEVMKARHELAIVKHFLAEADEAL